MAPPTVIQVLPRQSSNTPTDLLTGQSNGGIFSDEVPSSQMTLACVEVTKAMQLPILTPASIAGSQFTFPELSSNLLLSTSRDSDLALGFFL